MKKKINIFLTLFVAITVRFLTRRFIGEYQEDVEQTYRGLIDFGPDTIKYDLKDTNRSVSLRGIKKKQNYPGSYVENSFVFSFSYREKYRSDERVCSRQTQKCRNSCCSRSLKQHGWSPKIY